MMTLSDLKIAVDRAIDAGADLNGAVKVLKITERVVKSGNDEDVLSSRYHWTGLSEVIMGERLFLLPVRGDAK